MNGMNGFGNNMILVANENKKAITTSIQENKVVVAQDEMIKKDKKDKNLKNNIPISVEKISGTTNKKKGCC